MHLYEFPEIFHIPNKGKVDYFIKQSKSISY